MWHQYGCGTRGCQQSAASILPVRQDKPFRPPVPPAPFVEIGRVPRRDRFTSGSRSVRVLVGEQTANGLNPPGTLWPTVTACHPGTARRAAPIRAPHRARRPTSRVRPQRRDGAVRSLGGGAHIDAGLTGAGAVPHEAHPHLARARCRQNERPALGVDGARHLIGASLAPQSLDVRGQPRGPGGRPEPEQRRERHDGARHDRPGRHRLPPRSNGSSQSRPRSHAIPP